MTRQEEANTQPSWLDKTFIQNALRKGLKDKNLLVHNLEVRIATSPGDNYSSQIYRVNLQITLPSGKKLPGSDTNQNGDVQNFSVIIKALLTGLMKEMTVKFKLFDKEAEALSKVLPAINENIVKAYPDHERLWAECYYFQGEPNNLIVLEDLGKGGFVLANRFEGLDLDHSILIMKSLGKMHAASLLLKKEHPEYLDSFQTSFWTPAAMDIITVSLLRPINFLKDDVKTWPNLEKRELYSEKIKQMEEQIFDKIMKLWERDDSKLNVVIHGDCWLNNYMFRYDSSGKVNGVKIVDFQIMNLNSPVLDLMSIIFTSVKPELKFKYINFLLETYHKVFIDTLKRLNFQLEVPYELKDLKRDFESKYFWGMLVLFTFFPLSNLPRDELLDFDKFLANPTKEVSPNCYKKAIIQNTLIEGFKFFEEKGVF